MSVLIIAEIGVNHQGDEAAAYKLIDAAIDAGADVAKFQLFSKVYADGKYEHLRLSRSAIKRMERACRKRGIDFACTPFDVASLKWLVKNTKMPFVKIASGWHNPGQCSVLSNAGKQKLPLIISTAGTHNGDIKYCFDIMGAKQNIKLLHCVSRYPTHPRFAHLTRLSERWCSGLSDHSGDIFMPLAAVAWGAKIIECHITLDKNQQGYDHKASLEPQQFKEMVRGIRAIEKGLQ